PMAMLPFCGYNVGDYFAHWLSIGKLLRKPPKIFMVNWFRKDTDGRFLWPGYGENMRVLRWMVDRIGGRARGVETPVGIVPDPAELDLKSLDIAPDRVRENLRIDGGEWKAELALAGEFFRKIGPTLPDPLEAARHSIAASLNGAGNRAAGASR
ncbi:MAG TPA: phosphoenolpyruvate carboxykinase domain-containing protein, partial [Candidatus Binataceae bacterium]|nr:phosphoenolpyruvate carboxykinase domain-containing protein [Candidatus Binataceae bacterium]